MAKHQPTSRVVCHVLVYVFAGILGALSIPYYENNARDHPSSAYVSNAAYGLIGVALTFQIFSAAVVIWRHVYPEGWPVRSYATSLLLLDLVAYLATVIAFVASVVTGVGIGLSQGFGDGPTPAEEAQLNSNASRDRKAIFNMVWPIVSVACVTIIAFSSCVGRCMVRGKNRAPAAPPAYVPAAAPPAYAPADT